MTTNPQTVTQICSYLEISPTTFDRARRFVNGSKTHDDLESIGGDGKRGKAKQYDLGAAREALRLYSEQVRTNAKSRAGKPKRIGRKKRDFSSGMRSQNNPMATRRPSFLQNTKMAQPRFCTKAAGLLHGWHS